MLRYRNRFDTNDRSDHRGNYTALGAMCIAYIIGCLGGSLFAAASELPQMIVDSVSTVGSGSSEGLLSVLGGYGAYGLCFLIFSTTYLGFLLVPCVIGFKGFFTGCVFAAFLQTDIPYRFWIAAASLCAPGIFLMPALLVLGLMSMRLSYRLLRRYRGIPASEPPENHSQALAIVLLLLLAAAAIEAYAVPYVSVMFHS